MWMLSVVAVVVDGCSFDNRGRGHKDRLARGKVALQWAHELLTLANGCPITQPARQPGKALLLLRTRRAPSRHCCRDARLTTTAMHGMSTPSTPCMGKNVRIARMLEVSLSGVGTVLRLERNAWSMVE